MNLKDGELNYLTIAVMQGYQINNGDIKTMTPLQKQAMVVINEMIWEWKGKQKTLMVTV